MGVRLAAGGFAFDFWTAWVGGGDVVEAGGLLGLSGVGVWFVR